MNLIIGNYYLISIIPNNIFINDIIKNKILHRKCMMFCGIDKDNSYIFNNYTNILKNIKENSEDIFALNLLINTCRNVIEEKNNKFYKWHMYIYKERFIIEKHLTIDFKIKSFCKKIIKKNNNLRLKKIINIILSLEKSKYNIPRDIGTYIGKLSIIV